MEEPLFWICLLLGIYSYALYPLVLLLLPARRRSEPVAGDWPSIALIITARNEARNIGDKLENTLALPEYPGELDIVVASDASDDETDEIVKSYADRGVRLVRNDVNEGKEAAQALAIGAVDTDLLVFTDVATSLEGPVLERIAEHFRVPDVGALSSVDRFISQDGQVAGEGAYVRYEMWLRKQEARVSSLVGLSGSFFAARHEICERNWLTGVPSDMLTAVNCVREGYVAISADDVVGYYKDLADPGDEYRRKVRTVVRGMRALAKTSEVLNPFKYGFFALQVWSHKVMRWLAPWFLLALLPLNLMLLDEGRIYWLMLIGQALFYGLVLIGWAVPALTRNALVRIIVYFTSANVAVARAGIDFLRGREVVSWTPSAR